MTRKYKMKALFLICALASAFIYTGCSKKDDVSATRLDSFGPSGVKHGEDISFIGTGLDQVTSIIMPVGVEVPSAQFKTHTAGLIVLTVPVESTEGLVTLKTTHGDIVSKSTFGSAYAISVTSITPATAKPGTNITIAGDFLNYVKQITFKDGKVVTTFVSQTRTELVVTVPMDAQTGRISLSDLNTKPQIVEQNASLQDLVVTVMLPAVTGIAPSSLRQTDNLTLTGTNLDLISEIDFQGAKVISTAFVSQSATTLVVAIPNTATSGAITLITPSKLQVVPSQQVTVIEPVATAISTNKPGSDVTITGTDLDLVASIIFPDGGAGTTITTPFKSQSPTSIVVTSPTTANPGNLKFMTTHSFSVTVSSPAFNVTEPAVTNFSTSTPSASMTVTGTDLDLVSGIIFPGGTTVSSTAFTSQSPTTIVVTIPSNATSGTVKLATMSGFTVTVTIPFGSACVTSFPGSSLLYSFDTDLQNFGGGTYQAPAGLSASFSSAEFHSCTGSAKLTIPFTAYGQNADLEINPSPALDFTGKSKLHFWIKVQVPAGTEGAINGVQVFLNTGGYSKYKGNFINFSPTFADGAWHEAIFDLVANSASITIGVINQFGVQIVTQSAAPGGGPASPPQVVLFVDDIWLE